MNESIASEGRQDLPFIGRLAELQWLDRSIYRHSVILIHGMEGIGKTSLASAFFWQLLDSKAFMEHRVFWFWFEWGVRNAATVVNRLGIELTGMEFVLDSMEKRIQNLAELLREEACFIVWDNFEIVHGIATQGEQAKFPPRDQEHLCQLLRALRGGKSKVLITSRSDEMWLGTEECCRIELGGFKEDERLNYMMAVLSEEELHADLQDPGLLAMLAQTDGHPMAMRLILPQLKDRGASELCTALEANENSLSGVEQESKRKLLATLLYVEQLVPSSSRYLFAPLALHVRFVSADDLHAMATHSANPIARAEIDAFLQPLIDAGLIKPYCAAIYEIHSLLATYLRRGKARKSNASWQRSFAAVMAERASTFRSVRDPQRPLPSDIQELNFLVALDFADRLGMHSEFCSLLGWLKPNASNRRDLDRMVRAYQQTMDSQLPPSGPKTDVATRFKQGMIAWQIGDLVAAESALRKALESDEASGDEHVMARLSHALGLVKQQAWDLDAAKQLYEKALRIFERKQDEYKTANIYRNLGFVARKQAHFEMASHWLQKAQTIFETRGDQLNAARTYEELGILATDQGDFDVAKEWFGKSVQIYEDNHSDSDVASICHQFGRIAMQRGDLDAVATSFQSTAYRRTIEDREGQGSEYDTPWTYFQLGFHALQQREWNSAERWLRKSLETSNRQDNRYAAAFAYHSLAEIAAGRQEFDGARKLYGQAIGLLERLHKDDASATYHQLGKLEQVHGNLDVAESCYRKALEIDERRGDECAAAITYQNLGVVAEQRGDFEAANKWLRKSLDIKLSQRNQFGVATIYHQMGRVAEEQAELVTAEKHYRHAADISEEQGQLSVTARSYYALGCVAFDRGDADAAGESYRKALEIFERLGEERGAAMANEALEILAEDRDVTSNGDRRSWKTWLFRRRGN